ncbi:Reverse transcriptase [Phytophthora palmivora]|uniref:Reverse transcriptase n=1 Tax=Phytophthora palmivora TaxID=4796 RepID=A0A2P4XUN8_9STRA|nr:Reverse transcriptase [Phytophthora palmivora]
MRANKLYANIDKHVYAAEEIKVLGCFVIRVSVRADPGNIKAIAAWPTLRPQKGPRKWLGLANYLRKYSAGYTKLARPSSDLLKKNASPGPFQQHQVLSLPNESKSFRVVCDASHYAIGCALLQKDAEGRERVVSFQARKIKAAERNYTVQAKELFKMRYALVKIRLKVFVVYTDHVSLPYPRDSYEARMGRTPYPKAEWYDYPAAHKRASDHDLMD